MKRTSVQDTYWILRRDQIETLASARRQDVLDRLAGAGPCSVKDFAASVGMAPSAVYHHLQQLERTGLVREAGTRVVNRRSEKLYEAVAPRMRMARALEKPSARALMKRVVAALCRQMDRDFAGGIARADSVASGPQRNLGFFRLVGAPSPAVLEKINGYLDRISELLWTRRHPGAPLVALGWTMSPVGKDVRKARRRRTT